MKSSEFQDRNSNGNFGEKISRITRLPDSNGSQSYSRASEIEHVKRDGISSSNLWAFRERIRESECTAMCPSVIWGKQIPDNTKTAGNNYDCDPGRHLQECF